MEEAVWSFHNVTLRHRRYLVLLVQWSDFAEPVATALMNNAKKFGQFMKGKGALVMPYPEKMEDAFNEIVSMGWPDPVRERMEATQFPFLVIIDRDVAAFEPGRDPAAIVWFEDFEQEPEAVWKVLDSIARKVTRGQDVLGYLEDVETKARRAETADRAADLARYVDVGIPIIPGVVSIKAGAIFADVMRRLS